MAEFNRDDLNHPVIGFLFDVMQDDAEVRIEEGHNLTLALHVGRQTIKPVITVDQVGLHELGGHLEIFSGLEVTESASPNAWVPGRRISGIWNHHLAYLVFLTEVDGTQVAQAEEFYNANIDRTGQ